MDLGQILGGISQYIETVGANQKKVGTTLEENQALRQQGVEAVRTAVGLESELAQDDLNQQLTMERRKKATAEAFQTDILDPENRIAMLARQQAGEVDEALAQSRRASELMGQNIFDDPLSYLVARPFAGRHVEAAAAAQGRAQILDKAITDLNQQTQSTIQTQAAINEQLSVDEAGRRAALTALKASDAVRAAQIATNKDYVQDLKTLQGFDEEKLRYASEAYKLTRHEQEFQMRMEEAKERRQERSKIKRDEQENMQYMFERYNMGAELLGKTKAVNIADFQAMIKLNKKAVAEIAEKGESIWVDPSTGRTVAQIDKTPGESVVALSYFQGRLAPGAQRTSALLSNQLGLAQQTLRQEGGKVTLDDTANQVNKQLNGTVVVKGNKKTEVPGILQAMSSNMEQDVGSSRNIFRAPDAATMAQVNPSLAADPMWKQIVQPAEAASGPSPTVNSMLKQALLGIHEKTVTPESAAKFLSTYFSAALVTNGVNEQYMKVGISQPKSYPVQVESRAAGFDIRMDASNEQELRRYLANNPKFARTMGDFR